MKRQGGFTLIELVVVIVILGILAVTAAPRFLNLQDDARNSTLEGLKGAMVGAAGITYGKAAIAGQEGDTGAISIGTSTLNLVWGYPEATSQALGLVVDGLSEDWVVKGTPTDTVIRFGIDGYSKSCVKYTEGTANDAAKVEVVIPGEGDTECD
ncbi:MULTISPECIES: type II secretion system protein [unclassified Vibrio]|uniref:type II secretion system protein n=1 Tax=unclassified Vibrio TaxID=2614977 RepID=UPI000BFFE2A6|nr:MULTISPECIES: type II secretion system protein [unclassified Vibrio]PHJ41088.1 MSHA biogenesis protein MshA [Vibrio sp. PID17_43]RIZ52298.1 MSHA biogenesis protein MshA [Vibrio sp. PID23_8]